MDKIFNSSFQDFNFNITAPSFAQLKKANLLRIYLKEFVINKITKKIFIEESKIEDAKNNFFKEKNIFDSDQLDKFLLHKGINEKDLEYQISLPLKLDELSNQVNQNQIENHFLKRKDELDLYKYNVIRTDNSDLAHEIYFQLESRESDFIKLSNQYSIDKEVFPEGVIGPKNLVGTHPKIKEKLRNYDVGYLIKPFQIDNWWLIIKLIERKQAKLDKKTYKQMAIELCEIFIQNKVSELIKINISKF